MSDFLLAILDDVDKQVDIARSATIFSQHRKQKYVIKEAKIMVILNEAEYDEDGQLLDILTLLGLQMSGYIDGLRIIESQPEGDIENGEDTPDLESEIISCDHPSTSNSTIIY
ncbi:hypothetical protein ACQ4LE_010405 [Meloidogyne hapla]